MHDAITFARIRILKTLSGARSAGPLFLQRVESDRGGKGETRGGGEGAGGRSALASARPHPRPTARALRNFDTSDFFVSSLATTGDAIELDARPLGSRHL